MNEKEWIEDLLRINDEDLNMSEKQVKILEAAIESFSEKGFAATSTSEIAKKAGVAEGTIFRHYKTKKDLLMAIVVPTWSKLVAPFLAKSFVKEVFENKYESYEDFLRVLIKNRYSFAKKHIPIVKIFLQEIGYQAEFKEQVSKIFTEHVLKKFEDIVEHFQAKGELINIPPQTVIRMTLTNIVGFIVTRLLILPEDDWDDELEIERTVQFLMYGLTGKAE